jgi:hypothetical protein
MVIYRGSDGKPGYHQTDDIHDAVGFVESMRNEQGVEHARIFRLEEVVFQYRPYFRVELADSMSDGADDEAAASPTNGALGAGGANGLNGGGESYEPGQGEPVEALGPLDPPADSGADLAASSTGLGSEGSSDSADEGTGSGAKRGLFGR